MVNKIHDEVERLKRKYKTINPFEMADSMGIVILYRKLDNLKGFYMLEKRTRYIVINENLEPYLQKVICAHELGHDRLHKLFATYEAMQDYTMYDMTSKPEREANIFAADLLIPDSEILLSARMFDYTYQQISCLLNIPEQLLNFKAHSIYKRGYDIRTLEQVKANFLADL